MDRDSDPWGTGSPKGDEEDYEKVQKPEEANKQYYDYPEEQIIDTNRNIGYPESP